MLLRVGLMCMVTGVAFLLMGWLGATGPVIMVIGAICGAVVLESRLEAESSDRAVNRDVRAPAQANDMRRVA